VVEVVISGANRVSPGVELQRKRTSVCPGCGGAQGTPAEVDVRDARYGVPGLWTFLRCPGCGLVYLAETLADPAQGYPSTYSQHRRVRHVRLDRPWSPARDARSVFLELHGYGRLPRVVLPRPFVRCAVAIPPVRTRAAYGIVLMPPALPSGSLLDIGCGNGRFLTVMRILGWQVHGIEPDERSAENARRASGARIDAHLDDVPYPPARFDVITMNHVLEHIADPVPLLARCFRLCRPGGLLGIAVPNWRALGHRLFGRDWYALEPPRHTVMYEPRTLKRALESAGFHVRSVRTTSAREWATAWRRSWKFRTGRASTRALLAAWGAVTAVAGVVGRDAGEEVIVWAQKP
jgi:2-polyprenyl-3-methyl-5-hydroxy-6-metoxy-1,4-benzoquinol methylase